MKSEKRSIKKVIKNRIAVRHGNKKSPEKEIRKNKRTDMGVRDQQRKPIVKPKGLPVDLTRQEVRTGKNFKKILHTQENKSVSIIVTAYQTQSYIEECLDSIENQTYFINNDNYEVLVGVDGCKPTLEKLLKIRDKYRNLTIFNMKQNYGTYVTSNTLIINANSENIIRFDSDDIMMPNMVEEIMNYRNNDVVRFKFINFTIEEGKKVYDSVNFFANGVVFIKKKIFDELGGYLPWKCSADREFLTRGKGLINEKLINLPLFYRRIHKNSLISKYNSNSEERISKKKYIENNDFKIKRIDRVDGEFEFFGKIPKRIFFFWGNEKMSWMRYMTLYSFRKFNPDWKMTLYYVKDLKIKEKTWKTKNVQDFHSFNGDDYYDKINDLDIDIIKWNLSDNKILETDLDMGASHLSNFLKWSKLHEEGGIYSDLDILYFKPIDDFYDILQSKGYDTGICHTDYLSIGLLASKKGNQFYKDIFINGVKTFRNTQYQNAGVINIYNLYSGFGYSEVFDEMKRRYALNFYNIPFELIYFLDAKSIELAMNTPFGIEDFPEKSIGYHWYAGHPTSQKYNNLLTEKNYLEHNNTFTKLVKQINENNK